MAEPKTKPTDLSVVDFINAIEDFQVRQDCWTIVELMQAAAKVPPQMWGNNIIGFGSHPIFYAKGNHSDWPLICFSPRKQNLTLYSLTSSKAYDELHTQLGRHTSSKGCLYIKRLSDVDIPTLEKLIQASLE